MHNYSFLVNNLSVVTVNTVLKLKVLVSIDIQIESKFGEIFFEKNENFYLRHLNIRFKPQKPPEHPD